MFNLINYFLVIINEASQDNKVYLFTLKQSLSFTINYVEHRKQSNFISTKLNI